MACHYCNNYYCTGSCRNRPYYNPPYTQPFAKQCLPFIPAPSRVDCNPCGPCNPCVQVGCPVSLMTSCVLSSIQLPCLGFGTNTNLSVILSAIDAKLCQITTGQVPCYTWTTATIADPLGSLTWVSVSPTFAQYSNSLGCVVRLRGFLRAEGIDPTATNSINTQLFVLPVGSRPAMDKVLTVNLLVNSNNQFTSLTVPCLLIIRTTGEVILGITNFNPLVPSQSSCVDCGGGDPVATFGNWFVGATSLIFGLSLDGLTFDIQS